LDTARRLHTFEPRGRLLANLSRSRAARARGWGAPVRAAVARCWHGRRSRCVHDRVRIRGPRPRRGGCRRQSQDSRVPWEGKERSRRGHRRGVEDLASRRPEDDL